MKWKFGESEDSLFFGFSQSDIEKFGKEAIKSLVRESIQNSTDAADENSNDPVIVSFKIRKLDKYYLDNLIDIEEHLRKCLKQEKNEDTKKEIQRHIDAIESGTTYRVLEVADENTTGMSKEQFYSFTQSQNISYGKASNSQGSKGIGKAVFFASSYLRTVFTSTKHKDFVGFRGVAKLASRKIIDSPKSYNHVGFYGDYNDYQNKNENVPDFFKRSKNGTSICAIGFWEFEDFNKQVIEQVLINYWFAIMERQLEVIVQDECINSTNVREKITEYFPEFKDNYRNKASINPHPYFIAVEKGEFFVKEIKELGECKLWLHYDPRFRTKSVARFRKTKMFIYKEYDLHENYVGVFLCDTDEGNKFLKKIENDAHDEWNPKINKTVNKVAKEVLKEIQKFINEKYETYAGINQSGNSFESDVINDLFSFESKGTVKKKKPSVSKINKRENNPNRNRVLGKHSFELEKQGERISYKLVFTSTKSIKRAILEFRIGTDATYEDINVIHAVNKTDKNDIDIQLNSNKIITRIVKGKNVFENIMLDSPFIVNPIIHIKS